MKLDFKFNKICAIVLAFSLAVGLNLPFSVSAESYSVVDVAGSDGTVPNTDSGEKVMVIVELDSDSVLNQNSGFVDNGELTLLAKLYQNRLLNRQDTVINEISDEITGEQPDIIYSYTLLTNGFAIEIYPEQMDDIAEIKGVKSVYIPPEFEMIPTDENGIESIENADTTESAVKSVPSNTETGAGAVIAIIDTGIDLTHEAFQNAPQSPSLSQTDVSSALTGLTSYSRSGGSVSSYYYSEKIPYKYNYADKSFNVTHSNDSQGDHGTHVAGIAAGYVEDTNGDVIFSGAAPDAQLLVMKVFGKSGGASSANILAAAEDALLLGADVINLSLGTVGGFSYAGDYPALNDAFDALGNAGIEVVASAGNHYTSAFGNLYGNNLSLASNPDNGNITSPSSYESVVSVASSQNFTHYSKCITVGGRNVAYRMNADCAGTSRDIAKYSEQTLGLRVLCDSGGNVLSGTASDFSTYAEACGISGNFVMIIRGQNFSDTVALSQQYGAIGMIVFNNKVESLRSMVENTSVSIPAIFISQADGQYIIDNMQNCSGLYVDTQEHIVDNPGSSQMSDFSSIGVTPDLKLKPEITAAGENIYSSKDNSTYGLMSGTSMSSPYLAASYIIVKQHIESLYPSLGGLTAKQKKNVIMSIMMSSADIMTNMAVSAYYSPRKQGAGRLNIDAAMNTPVYLSVNGSTLPKLSLGDDAQKTGIYSMTFDVVNLSSTAQSYTIDPSVLTEACSTATVTYNGESVTEKFMSGNPMDIKKYSSVSMSGNGSVTVPAGGTASVTVTVTLGQAIKNYLNTNYENGIYIDGFVSLVSTGSAPTVSLPYLAFFGDWTRAPLLDEGTWQDVLAGTDVKPQFGVSTAYTKTYLPSESVSETYELGTNSKLPTAESYAESSVEFNSARTSLASVSARRIVSGDMWNNGITEMKTYLLRGAETLRYTVKNSVTDEVYLQNTINNVRKTHKNQTSGAVNCAGAWDSRTFFAWNDGALSDGTRVTVTVDATIAYGDGGEANNQRKSYSFDCLIDGSVPELSDVDFRTDANGNLIGDFSAYDSHYINSIDVTVHGLDAGGNECTVHREYICGNETEGATSVYSMNITEAVSGIMSTVLGVDVEVDDYAGNGRMNNTGSADNGRYIISFNKSISVVPSLSVNVGQSNTAYTNAEKYENPLSSSNGDDNNLLGITNLIIYTSSDESVATVSSNGTVTGISEGTAVISAKDIYSGVEDTCDVTVNSEQTPMSYYIRYVADGVLVANEEYVSGETVTMTVPDVPFKENCRGFWNRSLPETMPDSDYIITAVYFRDTSADARVRISSVGGGYVTYDGGAVSSDKIAYFTVGDSVTLTANERTQGSFMYWVNRQTDRIISRELNYSFTASTTESFEAVFCNTANIHNVTYCTPLGNILMSVEIPLGSDDISPPEIPEMLGYTVSGWDKEVSEYRDSTENVIVTAQYSEVAQTYTVSLTNTQGVSGGGVYDAFEAVTITATGDNFSYWTTADGDIVSYSAQYTFMLCFDCEFTAVFSGTVTPQPVVRVSGIVHDAVSGNVVFYAERSIPSSYTVVRTGLLLTTIKSIGESVELFTATNESIYKGTSQSTSGSGTYALTLKNYDSQTTYYARAYAVLQNSQGEIVGTVYGNISEF